MVCTAFRKLHLCLLIGLSFIRRTRLIQVKVIAKEIDFKSNVSPVQLKKKKRFLKLHDENAQPLMCHLFHEATSLT